MKILVVNQRRIQIQNIEVALVPTQIQVNRSLLLLLQLQKLQVWLLIWGLAELSSRLENSS